MALKKVTQDDLARATGISQATISRYLNGKVEPRLEEARRLAEALQMPVEKLMAGRAPAKPGDKLYELSDATEEVLEAREHDVPGEQAAEVALKKLYRRNRNLHDLLTRQILVAERWDAENRKRKK